jgi:DNA-binding transcriptional MerR regulator
LLRHLFENGHLRTIELCRLVGCTYRQLDYWCRTGLVVPYREANGSGSTRYFDAEGLRQASILTRLTALGISPMLIRDLGLDQAVLLLAEELNSIAEELVPG